MVKNSRLRLAGQVVFYAVPFWFAVILILMVMDDKDVRLQAIVLALAFATIFVIEKNTPEERGD